MCSHCYINNSTGSVSHCLALHVCPHRIDRLPLSVSVGLLSYWWCPVVALFSISCFPVHCEFIGQIRLCVCCNIVNLRIHFYQFKKKMTVLLALPLFRHNLAEHYQYSLKKSITYSLSPQSVWLSFINRFMYIINHCILYNRAIDISLLPNPPYVSMAGYKVCCFFYFIVWLSGNTLASINVVALRQTRLVLGCVTICGRVNHIGM